MYLVGVDMKEIIEWIKSMVRAIRLFLVTEYKDMESICGQMEECMKGGYVGIISLMRNVENTKMEKEVEREPRFGIESYLL